MEIPEPNEHDVSVYLYPLILIIELHSFSSSSILVGRTCDRSWRRRLFSRKRKRIRKRLLAGEKIVSDLAP